MNINELNDLLSNIPRKILIHGNATYTIQDMYTHIPGRIDINFITDNIVICYIAVTTNNTIRTVEYGDDKNKPEYKDCFTAMNNTKTYLELIGFQIEY